MSCPGHFTGDFSGDFSWYYRSLTVNQLNLSRRATIMKKKLK